jgi:hypothetical protein
MMRVGIEDLRKEQYITLERASNNNDNYYAAIPRKDRF